MTARYRMERNPDSGKNGNKMPLHPRLIPYETVSIKKLMKYAKSRSTYSEADIAGALQLITDLVTERLREGDNVEIEGLGFFSVSLQSRAVMSKTELRSESVRFKNVNFRCCQQLKKALKTMPLTRMKSSGHCAPGMADGRNFFTAIWTRTLISPSVPTVILSGCLTTVRARIWPHWSLPAVW